MAEMITLRKSVCRTLHVTKLRFFNASIFQGTKQPKKFQSTNTETGYLITRDGLRREVGGGVGWGGCLKRIKS